MAEFTCCGMTFAGESSYVEHLRQIHGEEPAAKHTCCGIPFYTDEGYAEHRTTIHGEASPPGRPAGLRGLVARLLGRS